MINPRNAIHLGGEPRQILPPARTILAKEATHFSAIKPSKFESTWPLPADGVEVEVPNR
jgi:hypothetical protein